MSVVLALLQHVGRYSVPASIQSDRGPEFVNEIIQEFINIIGTEHVKWYNTRKRKTPWSKDAIVKYYVTLEG